MMGFGFMKQAAASTKSNRELLKSKGSPYQNFDKSYITDSIISRKPLVFSKKASPAYLKELKEKLILQNKSLKTKNLIVISLTLAIMTSLAWLIFWS